MQRSRLLAAAAGAVDEWGCDGASVARITGRARVSRRTFYELFDNREECLVAVLDSAVERIQSEVAAAGVAGLSWRERVRGGLWVVLCFFDREPALARLCIVESQRAGLMVLQYRERVIERLAMIVDEGRCESSRSGYAVPVTAQGVVGAVSQVLYSRLLRAEHEPLCDLLGQLMAMIVLPYMGASAARREQDRPAPVSLNTAEGLATASVHSEPAVVLPMRLTYRTARVLQALADHPGSSNRQVSDLVGIHDQGQSSKLLARLQRVGLLENTANGAHDKGEPNHWVLTSTGLQITRSIKAHSRNTHHGRAA